MSAVPEWEQRRAAEAAIALNDLAVLIDLDADLDEALLLEDLRNEHYDNRPQDWG